MPAGTAPALRIIAATESDVPVLLSFVRKLAEYEKLLDQVEATEEHVRAALFGEGRVAEALLAYLGSEPVAFAVFFHNFSTFLGRPGIYLEDLFVDPPHRGKGIGKALLIELARIARARNCGRLEWAVLDWNESAIEFYRSLGAVPMDDWTIFRVTGTALARLAGEETS
jgi:GNAT superfamily N-acetyltransferase